VIGVFTSPRETFQDIGQRPGWIVPMLIVLLVSLTANVLIGQRVGWERIVRQSIEKSSSTQNLSAEQVQQAVDRGTKFASYGSFGAILIGVPLVTALMAAVLMGSVSLFGGKSTFKQAFSVCAHAGLVGVIGALFMIIVLYAKPPDEFDVQRPTAFNVGAFLNPETTGKALMSIATSIDAFTIWTIVLLAIGFSAISGKKSFTTGKAFTAVVLPFVLWVCIKAGWAAMFG
jgi:hypothetical protein